MLCPDRRLAGVCVPRHIGIIMDGNGRWAARRNLPRIAGHRAGVDNIRRILRTAAGLGVQHVTLYAFSTENWSRPADEVDGLMELLSEFIDREAMKLHAEGVRIQHLGSADELPPALAEKIRDVVALTRNNTGIGVAVALNYGGRQEIVQAMRALLASRISPADVDERRISEHLTTRGIPDPDLIIRTSGEHRLSNFLIWQAAYAEYWTTPMLWPDFGPEQLRQAIFEYSTRDRRYGLVAVRETPDPPAGFAQMPATRAGCRDGARPSDEVYPFATVRQAVADFQQGRFVLILDDEDRENEGDLAIAVEHVTPDAINFLATHARGLICMPIAGSRLDELDLPVMVQRTPAADAPAFTVSVDARHGVGSGVSAADRARTVKTMIDPVAGPADLAVPGHLFPLRYTEGGVLRRPGHTEASVDLAKLAGLYPAAVICEVMAPDGTMARLPELMAFARTHGILAITIQQLIEHRRWTEEVLDAVARAARPLVV